MPRVLDLMAGYCYWPGVQSPAKVKKKLNNSYLPLWCETEYNIRYIMVVVALLVVI